MWSQTRRGPLSGAMASDGGEGSLSNQNTRFFFFLIFFIFYSLWGLKENGVLVTRKFSGFFVEVFVAVVGWLVFK